MEGGRVCLLNIADNTTRSLGAPRFSKIQFRDQRYEETAALLAVQQFRKHIGEKLEKKRTDCVKIQSFFSRLNHSWLFLRISVLLA